MYKAIAIVAGIMMLVTSVVAQETTSKFEHHANLVGNILNCSAVEVLGYNDYNGCEISDTYNIIDSCYMEIGDATGVNIYHLAILSTDYNNGKKWDLYSDRVKKKKKGEDTFIYDNVISNEPIMDDEIIVPCERFFIPSEDENNGTFNQPCDFELAYVGDKDYEVGWNIAIQIRDDKLYIVGLCVWEHNSDLTYTKRIAYEYETGKFPLDRFERSMIYQVKNDKNPMQE